MKTLLKLLGLVLIAAGAVAPTLVAHDEGAPPVTPNASPEARALLRVLQSISGRYVLTGQHNDPNVHGRT
ncbi:MAG: hypothetical protein ACREFX_05860 [Opitutaceae bacterium]